MSKPRSGQKLSAKNIGAGFLMALLALSLLGFGVEGFGGGARSIGSVGGRDISTNEYARALQNELRVLQSQTGQTITMEQARLFGLDQMVLEQLVTTAALDSEADRLGVSAGDETVQREILQISAFQGLGGQFDREAYRFALQNAGLNESEFEDSIREDVARSILQLAVISAARSPDALITPLLNHQAQTRDYSVLTLASDNLETPVGMPGDAELQAFYDANIDNYTLPEGKRIRYAWLTPDMLIDTVEIEESVLRDAYEARASEFRQPERRLVERLVFADMQQAEDAFARLSSGDISFVDLAAERGLSIEDTDMGDVTRAQLGTAGDAVFALTEPGFAGPVETSLGAAVYQMNAILAARETPFEDAAPQLREELVADRARRILSDDLDLFEDLLAGGATVAELATETDMRSGEIDWRRDETSGIAAYESFRSAARELQDGDFPEIRILDDGGLFALELIEDLPPSPRPLDDIRTQVAGDWRRAQIVERLRLQAEDIADALRNGSDFAALELAPERFEGMTRTDFLPDLPRDLVSTAFDMTPDDLRIVDGSDRVYLVQLHDIADPDLLLDDVANLRDALTEQLEQSIAQDLFGYFSSALRQSQPIQFNQQVIDAVHANF
ncbi:peptidylprolyl isomerase [Roseinatronobacter alkalisoli]|uniref:Parvulin-like PPIase n=1 Tax=Roseinatronobacter alkalisoli TaxID=3028235 RepID=A0ABT5T684_9RHOB|nr:peptidylprolyl isomerase [Roseinatronobacter sp. HJB301]MDD7970491.1 SurA N-terminal domain-containing protein [Roseinatronobacter sp. HJB301]